MSATASYYGSLGRQSAISWQTNGTEPAQSCLDNERDRKLSKSARQVLGRSSIEARRRSSVDIFASKQQASSVSADQKFRLAKASQTTDASSVTKGANNKTVTQDSSVTRFSRAFRLVSSEAESANGAALPSSYAIEQTASEGWSEGSHDAAVASLLPRVRRPSTIAEQATPSRRTAKSKFSNSPGPRRRAAYAIPHSSKEQKQFNASSPRRKAKSNHGGIVSATTCVRLEPSKDAFADSSRLKPQIPFARVKSFFGNSKKTKRRAMILQEEWPKSNSDSSNGKAQMCHRSPHDTHNPSLTALCPASARLTEFDHMNEVRLGVRQPDSHLAQGVAPPASTMPFVSKGKRETILCRGSWLVVNEITDDVASAPNGRSKPWWSRWRKKTLVKPIETQEDKVRAAPFDGTFIRTKANSMEHSRSTTVNQRKNSMQIDSMNALRSARSTALTSEDNLSKHPRMRSASSNAFLETRKVASPTPPPSEPLPMITRGPSLRPLQLISEAVDSIGAQRENRVQNYAAKEDVLPTKNRNAKRGNMSLTLPYVARLDAAQKSLGSPEDVSEGVTQKTIGSSILFMDEELNRLQNSQDQTSKQSTGVICQSLSELSPGKATDVLLQLLKTYVGSSPDSQREIAYKSSAVAETGTSDGSANVTASTVSGLSDKSMLSPLINLSSQPGMRARRATCTTLETILTYQSSLDSVSDCSAIRVNLSDAGEQTMEITRTGGSALEELIAGVQYDVDGTTIAQYTSSSPQRVMIKSSFHCPKPRSFCGTMDSDHSMIAWPSIKQVEHKKDALRQEGELTILGAEVVEHELRLDPNENDYSPCPLSRINSRFRKESVRSAQGLRRSPSDLDLTKLQAFRGRSNDVGKLTVANILVPDTFKAFSDELVRGHPIYRRQRTSTFGQEIAKAEIPSAQSSHASPSAADPPPTIRVERPLSDSTLSTSHADESSIVIEEAQVQHASKVRMSVASAVDFSSVRAARTSLQGSRSRQESAGSATLLRQAGRIPCTLDSPTSLCPTSDVSASFAWSEKARRLSIGTTVTIPSPGQSGSFSYRRTSLKKALDSLIEPEQLLSRPLRSSTSKTVDEVRVSRSKYPDSGYSQSIMTEFRVPSKVTELRPFLYQSFTGFIPFGDQKHGRPPLFPKTVNIVEGREMPIDSFSSRDSLVNPPWPSPSSPTNAGRRQEEDSGDADYVLEAPYEDGDCVLDQSSIFDSCSSMFPTQSSPCKIRGDGTFGSITCADKLASTARPSSHSSTNSSAFSTTSRNTNSFNDGVWSPPTHFMPLNGETFMHALRGDDDAFSLYEQRQGAVSSAQAQRRRPSVMIIVQSPSTESHASSRF